MNTKKIPKYRIIENDIIDKINVGLYSTDDPLPTEAALVDEYKVSRVTLRQALSNLAYRGYIYKTQGVGTFIKSKSAVQRTPYIKSFKEDILEQGRTPRSDVVSFSTTKAGSTVSHLLGIDANAQVYYIERIRFADDTPIMFERTFMSVDLHPQISVHVLKNSKYAYAAEVGHHIEYAHQTITPIFPTQYIADFLRIPTNQPILRINNPTYLNNGAVFDYTELYMNTDVYQLHIIKKHNSNLSNI